MAVVSLHTLFLFRKERPINRTVSSDSTEIPLKIQIALPQCSFISHTRSKNAPKTDPGMQTQVKAVTPSQHIPCRSPHAPSTWRRGRQIYPCISVICHTFGVPFVRGLQASRRRILASHPHIVCPKPLKTKVL